MRRASINLTKVYHKTPSVSTMILNNKSRCCRVLFIIREQSIVYVPPNCRETVGALSLGLIYKFTFVHIVTNRTPIRITIKIPPGEIRADNFALSI